MSVADDGDESDPTTKAERDIALAEFNALRAEIVARTTAQQTLITLAVTAIGLVAGFVIKDEGDARLLLILPFLLSAAGIHSSSQDRTIGLIGAYVRDRLWPFVSGVSCEQTRTGSGLPSWECVVEDFRSAANHRNKASYVAFVFLAGLPGAVIFFAGSVVALVVVQVSGKARLELLDAGDLYCWVWWIGLLLTLGYAGLALSAGRVGQGGLSGTLKGDAAKPRRADRTPGC